MRTTQISRYENPLSAHFRVRQDAEFVALRRVRIDGTDYKPGDTLPRDSALRKSQARLARLCRLKILRQTEPRALANGPAAGGLASAPSSLPAPGTQPPSVPDHAQATRSRQTVAWMQSVLKAHGLSPYGRKAELAARIATLKS